MVRGPESDLGELVVGPFVGSVCRVRVQSWASLLLERSVDLVEAVLLELGVDVVESGCKICCCSGAVGVEADERSQGIGCVRLGFLDTREDVPELDSILRISAHFVEGWLSS